MVNEGEVQACKGCTAMYGVRKNLRETLPYREYLLQVGLGENILAIYNITLGKRVDRIGDYQLLWLL